MIGQNVYIGKWPWDDDVKQEIMNRKEMELEYVEFIEERSRHASIVAFSDTRTNIRYKNNSAEGVGLQGTTQLLRHTRA